jgi:hypothetical protein
MAQQGETSVVEKPQMPFQTAKILLADADRDVLEDRTFGDSEGGWCKDGREIAHFYFGHDFHHVSVRETAEFATTVFEADQAETLRELGRLIIYGCNNDGCKD